MVNDGIAPQNLKFLVADDHALFRRVIRSFLPGTNPTVVECVDGEEAVARYAEERPDCVLMDIQMGRMDGLAATRAIRRNFPAAHIIVVTQHDNADTRAAAATAGAAAFVPKDRLPELRALLKALAEPSGTGKIGTAASA